MTLSRASMLILKLDYIGLWDDFSASTDQTLGELVTRLKGE
jgi:hypothetical protein